MNELKISIIIPVYNELAGLRDTIDSLIHQTIERNQYEIIVANDGGSPEIEQYCKEINILNINIIPNKGSYNARNEALKYINSDNVAFTDADIIIPSDWLEIGLRELKNADYVVGPVRILKKDKMKVFEKYEYYTAFDMKRNFNRFHFGGTGNLFIKREIINKIGTFDSKLYSGGDNEFGQRIYNSKLFKQSYCEELLIFHPLRNYEDMHQKIRRVSKGLIMLHKLYPEITKNRLSQSFVKSLLKIFIPPNLFKEKYYLQNDKDKFKIFLFHWYMRILASLNLIRWMIKFKYYKII